MRFALAVTLMNDGYYAYEFGDTWHGNDWWYDELDFELGQACQPYARVELPGFVSSEHVPDGNFENATLAPWKNWTTAEGDATVTFQLDSVEKHGDTQSTPRGLAEWNHGSLVTLRGNELLRNDRGWPTLYHHVLGACHGDAQTLGRVDRSPPQTGTTTATLALTS